MARLAAIPSRTGAPPPRVTASLEEAERRAAEVVDVGRRIPDTVGLSRRQERARLGSSIDDLKRIIHVMGSQSLGGVEQSIRQMESDLEQARRLLDTHHPEEAARIFRRTQREAEKLPEIVAAVRQISVSGLPDQMTGPLYGALRFTLSAYRAGQTQRGDLALRSVNIFLQNRELLMSREGAPLMSTLARTMSAIGQGESMEAPALAGAASDLSRVEGGIRTAREDRITRAAWAFGREKERVEEMTQHASGTLREQGLAIMRDIEAMETRLRDDPAHVTDDEMRRLAMRVQAYKLVSQELQDTPEAIRSQTQGVFESALGVLASGGSYESFNIVMFAAEEVRSHPDRTSQGYRRDIADRAAAAARAEPSARDSEMGRLKETLSAALGRELQTASGRESGDTATMLAGIGSGLSAQSTAEDFQRARAAVQIEDSMHGHLGAAVSPADIPREGATRIYNRAFAMLSNRGDPQIAMAQSRLAELYVTADEGKRSDMEGLSGSLEQHPEFIEQVLLYLDTSGRISQYRSEMGNLPREARAPMSALIAELERINARLAKGQQPATDEEVSAERSRMSGRMESEPAYASAMRRRIAEVRGQNPEITDDNAAMDFIARQEANAAIQQRAEDLMSTAGSMVAAIRATTSATRKAQLSEIYGFSITATIAGRLEDGASYRDAAESYTKQTTPEDRRGVLETCRQMNSGTMERDAAIRVLTVYQQRGVFESRLVQNRSYTDLINARAYFDLALRAARGPDREAYQSVLDMAVTYGRMAGIPESRVSADRRQQRTDAMAFVRQQLGDYSRSASFRGGRRISQIGSTWTVQASSVTSSVMARAIISDSSVEQALGEGTDQDATERGMQALRPIQTATATHLRNSEDIEFFGTGIFGRSEADQGRADAGWRREAARLHRLGDQARARGDETAARFYDRQEALANPDFARSSAASARTVYTQGRAEQATALALSDELAGAATADIAQARRRIDEMIPLMPAGMRAEAERRRTEAGTDEARVRQLYSDILRQQIAQHGQNGELMVQTAVGIRDGLGSLDTSIQRIRTQHSEAGRFDLTVSIRTFVGIGTGQRVNLLGEPVDAQGRPLPPGGAPAPQPQEGEAPAPAVIPTIDPNVFGIARRTLQMGRGAVAQQERVQQVRAQIVGSARQVQHQNVETLKSLITQMISQIDESSRPGYQQMLTQAGDDLSLLQELYRQAGLATSVRTTDDSGHDLYDAAAHDRRARNAVGLAYAERFQAASWTLRTARLGIRAASDRQQVWIDDAAFRTEYDQMAQGNPFIGVSFGEYPVSEEGATYSRRNQVPATPVVIDTVISHLPPSSERDALRTRLAQIPAGSEGDAQRQAMLRELMDRTVFDPDSHRQVRMSDVVGGEELFYYHAQDYDRRLAESQRLIDSGRLDAAEAGLGSVEGQMSRGAAKTRSDIAVERTTFAIWSSRDSAAHAGDEFVEAMPTDADDVRGRGEIEDRAGAIRRPVEALAGSMRRDADDWAAARDSNESARDSIVGGGSILQATPQLVITMVGGLSHERANETLPNGKTYNDMVFDIAAGRDEAARRQATSALYAMLASNPADFRAGLTGVRGATYLEGYDSSIDAQLEATATTLETGGRHQQRVVAWQYGRMMIRAGLEDLRTADQSQRYRKETSEEMRDEERRLGWAPHRYTDEAFREFAARRFEAALAATDEHNDSRFYDLLVRNEPVSAPIYEYRTAEREWHPYGHAYITVYSSLTGNFGMGGRSGRAIGFAGELGGLNYRETRELTSFADDDIWDSVRPLMEQRAEDRTTLELATLGIGRVWHGDDGTVSTTHATGEGYWGLSRLHLTQPQQEALGEAYSQFMQLDGEMGSVIFAHDSPWGATPQLAFLQRVGGREGTARDAGLAAIGRLTLVPDRGEDINDWFERPDLERSSSLLADSVPFVQRGGQYVDEDPTTVEARASMGRWRSGYRVTVGVGKFAVATAGIVLAPATGGGSLVLTAGVGAMGIAEGFEQRAQMGKWTFSSGFTVGVGVVMTVLPFAGELAAGARGVATVAEGATELAGGTEAVATGATAVRTLTFGQRAWQMAWGAEGLTAAQRAIHLTGNALILSGIGQFGIQLPSMIHSVENGDMTWWEASFYGFQAVVQPLVAARYAQLRSAPGEAGGIPRYVPRWRQVIEAGLLGVPMQSAEVHVVARDYAMLQGEIGRLPQVERATYRATLGDAPLGPRQELGILRQYNEAREAGRATSFEQYAASAEGRRAIDLGRNETVYSSFERAISGGGIHSLEEFERYGNSGEPVRLTESQRAYIRARAGGAEPADAFAAASRAAPEERAPGLERLRTVAELSAFRGRIASRFTSRETGPGGERYTMGRGDDAITYTQQHVETASDIIYNTERVLRENPDFARLPHDRQNEILSGVPERIRSQVSDLAIDPEFRRAAEAPGGPDTAVELRLALGKASYVPDIAANPAVMDAGYATEVRPIIENHDLTAPDLAEFAQNRRSEAQEMRERAFQLRRDAESTVHTDVERQGMTSRAERLEARATALDHSADRIERAWRQRADAGQVRQRASDTRSEARSLNEEAAQMRAAFREEETRLSGDTALLQRRRAHMEEDARRLEERATALENTANEYDGLARSKSQAARPAAHVEEGRAGPIAAEAHEAPLTADQQSAVTALVNERGMSQQSAEAYVRDRAARPDQSQLGEDMHGMPNEFYGRNVPVMDEHGHPATRPFRDAPRAQLLGVIDNDTGAGGGVYRARIMVDGQPREVAVKVFRNPQIDRATGLPRWENNFQYMVNEARSLEELSNITVTMPDGTVVPVGPRTYGVVNVDGNYAIAMDIVPGRAIEDMSAAEIRRYVTPETYRQLGAMWDAVVRAGYDIGDFQFAVLTRDAVVGGVQRHVGDVVFWDAGGMHRANPESPPDTAAQVIGFQQRIADITLGWDRISFLQARAEDTALPDVQRSQARHDLELLDYYLRSIFPDRDPAHPAPIDDLFRQLYIGGRRDPPGPGETEGRFVGGLELAERFMDSLRAAHPQDAPRLEAMLRRFETESGIEPGRVLPEARPAAATARREATTGMEVEEVTTPARPAAPSPRRGEATTPARRGGGEPSPPPRVEEAPAPPVEAPQPARPSPRGAEIQHNVEDVTDAAQAEMRARVESGLASGSREVLDVAEALLGKRGDISRTEARARVDAWENARDPRAHAVSQLISQTETIGTRFNSADPVERAIFADALMRARPGASDETIVANAYEAIARLQPMPETGADITSVASGLEGRTDRVQRIDAFRRTGRKALADALDLIINTRNPQVRQRVAAEWQTARTEVVRQERISAAQRARTPQQLAADERSAVGAFARARGLDEGIVTDLYGEGGTQGRLDVLEGIGVRAFQTQRDALERGRAGIAAMEQRLGRMAADDPARASLERRITENRTTLEEGQRLLDSRVAGFFDLVVRGGLQGRINELPGFQGTTITDAEHLGGIRGVYRVELSDGRHVFVKMEDEAPASFGGRRARVEGLLSAGIHDGFSFDTGITYTDPVSGQPATARQEFGIIEDIRSFSGQEADIRMPDGRMQTRRIDGIEMVTDILAHPDPSNPFHREFYGLLSTPEGRQQIARAWRAYQEMSRRAGLSDRFRRNSAMAFSRSPQGNLEVTFHPIDTDAISTKIYSRPQTGRSDFSIFDRDFADATASFMLDLVRASQQAQGMGGPQGPLIGGSVSLSQLYSDFMSPVAEQGARLPPDPPGMMARARQIISEYDGRPFGIGFESYGSTTNPNIGDQTLQGGRLRIIERADGRVTMHADEELEVANQLASHQDDFVSGQPAMIRQELSTRLVGLAERIAAGESISGGTPGYDMARAIASDPAFAGADAAGRRQIAERTLGSFTSARAAPGRGSPPPEEISGPEIIIEEGEPVSPSPRPARPSPPTENVTPGMIVEERPASGRPSPPPAREEATTPARRTPPTVEERTTPARPEQPAAQQPVAAQPRLLTGPEELHSLTMRAMTGDPTATAEIAGINQTGQDAIAGYRSELEGMMRQGPSRHGLIDFAERYGRGDADAVEHFSWMPGDIQQLVRDFIAQRADAFDEDAMAAVYAQHMRSSIEIQGVTAVYNVYAESHAMPADPVDALAIRFLTAGGAVAPETLPQARRATALTQAAEFRTMAQNFVRGGGDIRAISDLAQAAREPNPPNNVEAQALGYGNARRALDAYTFVRDMARMRALQEGRSGAPTEEDYVFASLLVRTIDSRPLAPSRVDHVTGMFDPLESQGTPQAGTRPHLDVAVATADGATLYTRVFSDRVTVIGADPLSVIGRPEWPSPEVQTAYLRYAQRRFGPQLTEAFRPASLRIDESAFLPGSARTAVERTRILDSARFAIESRPQLARSSMTGDRIIEAFQGRNPVARLEAESAFLRLGRTEQDAVISELRFFRKRAEADYLAARRTPDPAGIVDGMGSRDSMRMLQARRDFARLGLDGQLQVLERMRQAGMDGPAASLAGQMLVNHFTATDFSAMGPLAREFTRLNQTQQDAVVSELHRRGMHDGATYLNELAELYRGPAGAAIGRIYGIGRQELADIYAGSLNLQEARGALARRLGIELTPLPWEGMSDRSWVSEPYRGFNRPEDDNFLFGMLLSGDMPAHVADIIDGMYPGEHAHGRISSVEFHNGAIGAYEVHVSVSREVERPGGARETVIETRTLYVKRQNLMPDAAGAEYSRASGIPAPEVHVATATGDMEYTMLDGTRTRYGILESMSDYRGTIRRGGIDLQVRARAEMGIRQVYELHTIYETLRTSTDADARATAQQRLDRFTPQQLELYRRVVADLTSDDPHVRERFWNELGFTLTGSYAVGLWDRHEINLRVMDLEITQPLTEAQIAHLRTQGVNVVREADGTLRLENPAIGGIDTDAAGVYMTQEVGGRYWFGNMNHRFGNTDLHRMFDVLSGITGRSVPDLVHEAFGDVQFARNSGGSVSISGTFNGSMATGARRFWTDFGNNPAYQADIVQRFMSHSGEPIGMGYPLGPVEIGMIRSPHGAAQFNSPQSGDPFSVVIHEDGRSENRPSYEISYGAGLTGVHPGVLHMFTPGQDMYVFQITPEAARVLPSDTGARVGAIDYTDAGGRLVKRVGVISASDPLVAQLQQAGVPLVRARRDIPPHEFASNRAELPQEVFTLGIIRADPGFGELTGITSTAVGPVPTFQALMHAGEPFMDSQFTEIGGYILGREAAVRPPNPPPRAAPGNLHTASHHTPPPAPSPHSITPPNPTRAQPLQPPVQGGTRRTAVPPQASPVTETVSPSELIHPMSPDAYQRTLAAAPVDSVQRAYVRDHFTGAIEPFETTVANALDMVGGLRNVRAGNAPLEVRGYYDSETGRILSIGGEPPAQHGARAVEFNFTVDHTTGRIASMDQAGMSNSYLSELVGMQVMPGRGGGGPGGGGPGGRGPQGGGPARGGTSHGPVAPPRSGGPQARADSVPTASLDMSLPEHREALATRILSSDSQARVQARERFDSLSVADRRAAGYELAYGLHLDTQDGVTEFGRRLISGRGDARELLAMLPEEVRGQVERLAGSGDLAAQFRVPRTRGPAVQTAWNQIQQMLHVNAPREAPAQQQARAVPGGRPVQVVGRPLEEVPQQAEARPDAAYAMAGDRRSVQRFMRSVEGMVGGLSLTLNIETGAVPRQPHVAALREVPATSLRVVRPDHLIELSLRMLAGNEDAMAAFSNLSEVDQTTVRQRIAQIVDVGLPVRDVVLHLNEPEDMRAYARMLARGDPDAVRLKGFLPEAVRTQAETLSAERTVGIEAAIEPHYENLIPMLERPGGPAELDNYLLNLVHIRQPDLAVAREAVLATREGSTSTLTRARMLRLSDPEGLRLFAQRVADGDADAAGQLALLPRTIRGQVEQFIRNPAFLAQQAKLRSASGRIGDEMLNIELRLAPEPQIAPGSLLERAQQQGQLDVRRVAYYDRRLSDLSIEEGQLVVRDDDGTVYSVNDALAWEATQTGGGRRTLRTNDARELSFVLRERYAAYRESLYTRQVETEFRAQTEYRTIDEFRAHLESAIPLEFLDPTAQFSGTQSMDTLQSQILGFVLAHPEARFSDAQMQLIANRISERLGVGAVDISRMTIGNHNMRVQDLVEQAYLFTEGIVHDNSGRTRVYLWRDAGGFMAVDAVLSRALGAEAPRGAFINRVAFGQAGVGRTDAGRVNPVEATAYFDRTVRAIVERARDETASMDQGQRYQSFMSTMRRQITQMRESDPVFDGACRQMLGHLESSGIIHPDEQVVFDGVLVDSSSRTLLPFTKALLESVYGDRVRIDIQYFRVASGYEFLPNLGVPQQLIDTIESAGATSSFVLNNQDYNQIEPLGGTRLRDSMLYFLMLRNRALQGGQ